MPNFIIPHIIGAPHDFRPSFTEFEDDIAVFVCLMFGDPPPVPSWTFNDAILTSSNKHFIDSFIYDDNPEFPYEFEVFARLAVYDAYRDHETDSGNYTCIGHNMHGEASTSIPFYPGELKAIMCCANQRNVL